MYKYENLDGLIKMFSTGQEYGTTMVSSDESVDKIKLSHEKGNEMGYLIGSSKVYKYENIDGSLNKMSLG